MDLVAPIMTSLLGSSVFEVVKEILSRTSGKEGEQSRTIQSRLQDWHAGEDMEGHVRAAVNRAIRDTVDRHPELDRVPYVDRLLSQQADEKLEVALQQTGETPPETTQGFFLSVEQPSRLLGPFFNNLLRVRSRINARSHGAILPIVEARGRRRPEGL